MALWGTFDLDATGQAVLDNIDTVLGISPLDVLLREI